ncbi:MAG: hypothetical protein LBK22_07460 [Tannerella sp.]|jgi:hypothetical protein|nr:hypothetical protein [Tannerella sp.]
MKAKMKFIYCMLCLMVVFGCDNSDHLAVGNKFEPIGLEKDTLEFPGDASSTTVKTAKGGRWGIEAFRSADDPFSELIANTTYMKPTADGGLVSTLRDTLSYEWIEAVKTDEEELQALQISVAENTSGVPRSIRVVLVRAVDYADLVVIQQPKEPH